MTLCHSVRIWRERWYPFDCIYVAINDIIVLCYKEVIVLRSEESAKRISSAFSVVYFQCHPSFDIELSHQAVRVLQYVQMNGSTTIQQISGHLGSAQNTVSEIVRRLRQKGLIEKRRRTDDERVVEVHLTDSGEKAVLQHTGLDVGRLSAKLQQVSEEDQDRIEQGLSLLVKVVGGDGD